MPAAPRRGFTLVELMVVLAVLVVVASLAIPNLVSARMRANETSAVAILRTLASAQAEFRAKAAADADGDGAGEYGYFAELAGLVPPRGSQTALIPPVLSSPFRILHNGRVKHSGYYFRIFLPDANGVGLPEAPTGGSPGGVDPDTAEVAWCCYAWPANRQAGERVFCVNQQGDILASDNRGTNQGYGGNVAPPPDAAFLNPATAGSILGLLAVGTVGSDGGVWVAVQ